MSRVVDHPILHWLAEWGRWARSQNRARLGFAQVGYSEHIAVAHSASDWAELRVDPEVLALDQIIRVQLVPTARQMIVERYVNCRTDSQAARFCKLTRSEYNKMLNKIVLPQLRHLWDLRKTT